MGLTKWAGTVHPRIISMENVPEFMSWGSLCARRNKDGRIYRMDGTLAEKGTYVPPPFATALARANVPEWCTKKFDTMKDFISEVAI